MQFVQVWLNFFCTMYIIIVPALISSVEEVSSTAGTLTLMVDVNQQNCSGRDTLTITATIAHGDTIISTQEDANFTDGSITFESIPDCAYTCTVTVVDGMGPIESQVQQIPCGNSPTSGGRTLMLVISFGLCILVLIN